MAGPPRTDRLWQDESPSREKASSVEELLGQRPGVLERQQQHLGAR